MPTRIRNKVQMYDLLIAGKLGNTLQLWRTPEDMLGDYTIGLFTDPHFAIRSMRPQGPFWPHIPILHIHQIREVYREYLEKNGHDESETILAEMDADGGKRTFTAEVGRVEAGLVAKYSLENSLYRQAMERGITVLGFRALETLRAYLDPQDVDDVMTLMDEYTDSVVELTSFEYPLGWARRRMIVWEVRSDY